MSMRTTARSSSNRKSASALASSVLPTPVGPRNRNDPVGRSGSAMPARARRTASDTARTASSCPITRACSSDSIRSSFAVSPSSSRPAGIPVHAATTSATSSGPTSPPSMAPPDEPAAVTASVASVRRRSSAGIVPYRSSPALARSRSRSASSAARRAFSSSSLIFWTSEIESFSRCHRAVRPDSSSRRSASSRCRRSRRSREASSLSFDSAMSSISRRRTARSSSSIATGRLSISIRSREAASSIRSMALSGRNRAVTYRSDRVAAATRAASVIRTPWCTS